MAFPQGSAFWREGSGLWPYRVTPRRTIGFGSFRSPASFSCNLNLRVVHRWRVASPGPETGGPLQHPVAQTVETSIVPTGFDHLVRPASTAKDRTLDRAAISACGGKTRARAPREGRCDR